MKLAVDVLGGDHAPGEIIAGVNRALRTEGLLEKVYLVGDKTRILPLLEAAEDPRIEYVQTTTHIAMEEHPAQAYRQKKDASITLASCLVKEGKAEAVLSAGSTGAQLAAALFEIGRIRGIQRPAITVTLPKLTGGQVLLLDAGANTEADVTNLTQFAQMGKICYQSLHPDVSNPRVSLVNNGTESTKGTEILQHTHKLLAEEPDLRFVGFVEGNHLLDDTSEVLVTDGFTGNVVLKTLEGMGSGMFNLLAKEIRASRRYMLGALLLKPLFSTLKKKMDARTVGGAPLLGINGVSIVCHGNSDGEAIFNGILIARRCVEAKMVEQIASSVKKKAGDEIK